MIALSCSEPPKGNSRWSLRLLADKVVELQYIDGISHEAVRQILKNELKPRRNQAEAIPPRQNGTFVAQTEQILELYKYLLYPGYPVVCMNESPKQFTYEAQNPILYSPSQTARHDYENYPPKMAKTLWDSLS